MHHVLFNRTDEFLQEARACCPGGAAEHVIRVSWKQAHNLQTGMTALYLCAGFQLHGEVICLEDLLAEDLTARLAAEGLPSSAVELHKRLTSQLKEWGFKIRGGIYVL